MHKYRIVIETERSGKKWYYVQKKGLLFWSGVHANILRNGHASLEEAEATIEFDIDFDNIIYNKQIVKREYLLK